MTDTNRVTARTGVEADIDHLSNVLGLDYLGYTQGDSDTLMYKFQRIRPLMNAPKTKRLSDLLRDEFGRRFIFTIDNRDGLIVVLDKTGANLQYEQVPVKYRPFVRCIRMNDVGATYKALNVHAGGINVHPDVAAAIWDEFDGEDGFEVEAASDTHGVIHPQGIHTYGVAIKQQGNTANVCLF